MRRGEIWTLSGGGDYSGKPRPAVIVQEDSFDATSSVTVCAFTSDPTAAPLFRVLIEPSEANGLREASSMMVDKVTTVRRDRLGYAMGRLDVEDIVRLNRALMGFLGLAISPRA